MARTVFLIVVALAEPALANQTSIAVLPLASKTLDANKVSVLDSLVVTGVSEIGKYRVVSAADVNAMLGLEKMKSAVGCTDLTCAAEIGGALGVDFLFTGTANVLGSKLILTSALLDIQKAEAVSRKQLRISNDEDQYFDAIRQLVAMTFGLAAPAGMSGSGSGLNLGSSADGAKIEVTSDAPGKILLDGRDTGFMTPYVLSGVPVGSHAITVVGPGKRGRGKIMAERRGNQSLRIQWSEDVTGSVRVDSGVAGANVSLDGRSIGKVPQLFSNIPTGKHSVSVSAMGFKTWTQTLEVPVDSTLSVSADLKARRVHDVSPRFFMRFANWKRTDDCSAGGSCGPDGIYDVGFALDYRWRHSEKLALKLRVGIDNISIPEPDHQYTSGHLGGLFGVAEQFSIPLLSDDDPIATVSDQPFALNLSAGTEVLFSSILVARAIGTVGFQLWWLHADYSIGTQYASNVDVTPNSGPASGTSYQMALDTFFMGFELGLTFAF